MFTLDFTQPYSRFLCGAGLGAAVAFNSLACSKIVSGISDFGNNLANPDLITVGGPGTRVAKGSYASPLVDPWDDAGPVVVAFEFLSDGPHLAMRPLNANGGSGCDTGLAYSSIVRDKLDNLTQLIAYSASEAGDADGFATVHFVDHQCKEYGQPVRSAKLPSILYADPPGYLIPTSTQLLVVAPWSGTTTVLAENLTWWDTWVDADKSIAVIDGGHFKIFDGQHRQIADIGTAVTQMTRVGTSGGFLLVDGGVLRTYQSLSDTAPVQVALDACNASIDPGGCLFYYSPCSSRQLQCYRTDTSNPIIVDTGVQSLVSTRWSQDSKMATLYTKTNADDGSTELWLYRSDAGSQSLMVPKFAHLYGWSAPAAEIDALVNSDGEVGQAMRYTFTADPVLVADAVSANFSQGLLANFDRTLSIGDLYTPVQLGQTPQLVANAVPYVKDQDIIVSPKNQATLDYGKAAITGSDGTLGDLTLLRYPLTSAGPDSPRVIASDVAVGNYRFFTYMNALTYTDAWDIQNGVGNLNLYELDLDATTFISEGVREFLEIFWPWEGIMYVVPNGDRAGIWVTRAK